MPASDLTKLRATQHRYRERHRDDINARKRAAYRRDPAKHQERARAYRASNYEEVLAANREYGVRWRARMKAEMIAAYGGCCACCGEPEQGFLQLDHINNDGAMSRRRENANGAEYWVRLKRRGWPKDGYQLLCANCNWGRRMDGICPHAKNR
jgi:hypothetical protein